MDPKGPPIPKDVYEKWRRAQDEMRTGAPQREVCWDFWRGDQYSSVTTERTVFRQTTQVSVDSDQGKPNHRIRRNNNLITPVVGHKVSAATSRIPGYEINPSTVDPEDQAAARLGGKIARMGYSLWDIRKASVDCVTYALVIPGGGYAWPYFDVSVGPFIETEEGAYIGQGEVKVRTFGADEVGWEPGIKFEESPFYIVEQARTVDEVKALAGFLEGAPLRPDALPGRGKGNNAKLVLTTDFLERPCSKYPNGRWFTLANQRLVVDERPYPLEDGNGNAVDEPVLHSLAFIRDPDNDRDMSLVEHLLDPQRGFNHADNKQSEWIQLALNPQLVVKNGKLRQKLSDEPGAQYNFTGSGDVSWRDVPPIPPELQQKKDDIRGLMQFIAADQDIPSGVEAARGIEALLERDQSVWQEFYANVADWHGNLMRHCLMLVQRFYDIPRLMQIRGRFGVESIQDFTGADLRGQTDVVVLPGSVTPRTQKEVEQKVAYFADRGWVSPEAAMAAMNGGTAEALVESYELDVGRAHRILQRMRAGPEEFIGTAQPQLDPETGMELPPMAPPEWMPRQFDNLGVHKTIFEDWMKTEDYEMAAPEIQHAAQLYYDGLLFLEAQAQLKAAMAQAQMAGDQGMQNAAKPQGPPSMPDSTALNGDSHMPSPNQPPGQRI